MYDYFLTFPSEFSVMWSLDRPFTGAKLLFFLNRYCSIGFWICLLLKDFCALRDPFVSPELGSNT